MLSWIRLPSVQLSSSCSHAYQTV